MDAALDSGSFKVLQSRDWSRLAGVAELVDAPGLGPGDESRGGSSPSARTKTKS